MKALAIACLLLGLASPVLANGSARTAIGKSLGTWGGLTKEDHVRTVKSFPGGTRHAELTRRGGDKYLFSISSGGKAKQIKMPEERTARASVSVKLAAPTSSPMHQLLERMTPNRYSDADIRRAQGDFAFNTMVMSHKLYEMGANVPHPSDWNK